MNQNIERVIEFHNTTESPVLKSPTIPSAKRIDLRIALIDEELNELEVAANQNDLTEVLDALCDLQYVLNGTIIEFGLQDVFQEAFEEVHRSNMSKFPTNTEDAKESVNLYYDKEIEAYYKKVGDNFVIKRMIDDKILKGSGFKLPAIKAILKNYAAKAK